MVTMIVAVMFTGYFDYNDGYSNGYWLLWAMVTMMVIAMVTGYYGNNDSYSNGLWLLWLQ